LVASYFGQHRSSNSFLYGRLRELRGLNYGDYAYIEYFPRGMFQFEPDPNLARASQIFQIWIRPVEPQNANFALRATLYEYDKLVKNGLDQKTFEETRNFLAKYTNILTQTKDAELGYALDSRYYGIPNFNQYMKTALSKLTLADVNRAIKTHLASNKMRVVMITKDAEGLRDDIVNNKPATITYAAPKPEALLSEDKIIFTYPIRVKASDVTITPINRVFE
jgi:zinc protease